MVAEWGRERPVDDDGGSGDFRSPAQRDSDRILYSSAFRRLTGVTQVVSRQDEYVHHDRLTHSLKVAQVAHRLTQQLTTDPTPDGIRPTAAVTRVVSMLDEETTAAASLAHDLGHPPFGHAAEEELQAILRGEVRRDGQAPAGPVTTLRDSFEGNAQSFRIVTKLALRKRPTEDQPFSGLNLAWKTLAAILKYPWIYGENPAPHELLRTKWGCFDSESDYLERSHAYAEENGLWSQRSVEAAIMDWADDIAYAVHDLEDFYRAGIVPLSQLKSSDSDWESFRDGYAQQLLVERWERERPGVGWDQDVFVVVADRVRTSLPDAVYTGTATNRYDLHAFASENIRILSAEVYRLYATKRGDRFLRRAVG